MNMIRQIQQMGYSYAEMSKRIRERTGVIYAPKYLGNVARGKDAQTDKLAAILLLSFPDVAFEAVEERR